MLLQVWQWQAESVYHLRHVMLKRDGSGWSGQERNVHYRALLRVELDTLLERAGFAEPRWLMPVESSPG